MIKKFINNLLIKTTNYRLVNNYNYNLKANLIENDPVLDEDFVQISKKLNNIYNQETKTETNYSAYQTIKNIINLNLNGNIVECGVYQGQKISYFLETLQKFKKNNFDVYIIDTFEGMTEPSNNDVQMVTGYKLKKNDSIANLDEVKENIYKTNYPRDKLHFVKIDVRKVNELRNSVKGDIAILRLDTDFYDSTLAILNSLYFKVVKNGFIIHDDYGHWQGHYDACQEFYKKNNIRPILFRTCRKERIEIKL